MTAFINISTQHGGYYYDLFYFLAILFSLFALIIAGKRRNYPMIPWMLSLLMILLFLILGTKIFTLSPGQWAELIQHGKMPVNTGRTIPPRIILPVTAVTGHRIIVKLTINYMVRDFPIRILPVMVKHC
ncbi:MAG: hypothetical protein JW723_06110 [Bacteroidales bacterium]|nr:hypothetical protein [Bacteroidales bacterium]